jgi:hypothetical protein
MLPRGYVCNACGESFEFSFREALYYVGSAPIQAPIASRDLLRTLVRPAWCKDCGSLCLAEDIESVRVFEPAYGMTRSGRPLQYPIDSEHWDPDDIENTVRNYLTWRMQRRHPARALCCGRTNYQFMDVPQPLFKHEGCDFGFIEPKPLFIGSYNWSGPGIHSPANTPVFSPEGELLGRLTWCNREDGSWQIEATKYPPFIDG